MDLISSTVYGVIQGLTEFLPVSSSGHLAILPKFLEIKDPGVLFDLSMHVGTALSICFYFREQVKTILGESFLLLKGVREASPQRNYVLNMIFSTIATFSLALAIKGPAEAYGRSSEIIAFNLFLFGILMFVADYFCREEESGVMEKVQIKHAIAIGIFQALAIFPGVSRSGSTLTISRFLGLSRVEATEYSFLLSIPVIFAGFVFKLPEFFKTGLAFDWGSCIYGMVISFIVGLITIHFFLKVIKNLGLGIFSLYRVILAAVIISTLS